jgi:hypothetical protein
MQLFLLLIGFKSLSKNPKEKWKYIAFDFNGTFIPAFLYDSANRN